ncbi:uncharacterized protein MELLADRAFT_90467 [Melampsora larici-populina 98AG31]|uniref:Uncharacterized protein n=1 Tax=Melampsora larici-populina (strain 98AG31 / pathotype 3-4-7) TaxID=747676 RepID=F4RX21_MELLP|nr:uncharacterized protein MELLADRAFT_90467 [Melampsora larici-populina 98AG31]EGG03120.1 hypothetical protein MELLADRAFT_90467 [Melampsora larici-populina 98AG31]
MNSTDSRSIHPINLSISKPSQEPKPIKLNHHHHNQSIKPKLEEDDQNCNLDSIDSTNSKSTNRFYKRFKLSTVQYAFLAVLILQSISIIAILSSTVSKIKKEIQLGTPQLTSVSTYLVIFIIANVFSIVMTFDSLFNKNVVQLISLCLFNFLMAAYGAVLPRQIKRALQNPGGPVSWNGAHEGTSCNMYVSCYGVQYLYGDIQGWIITIPVITGFCSCLLAYLTWLIYKEFGWDIFKQIGADLRLKRIIQQKYVFYMLQKFNLFFFIGFSVQFLVLSGSMSKLEKAFTICALPFGLAVIILAGIAVSHEIKWMIAVYAVVWVAAMSSFVFKLVRIFQEPVYASAVRSLTLFSVLSILSLFATGIMVGLCYQNFGRGIKRTTMGSPWLVLMKKSSSSPTSPTGPTRMSLD